LLLDNPNKIKQKKCKPIEIEYSKDLNKKLGFWSRTQYLNKNRFDKR
jgi:hypothetical protein